MTEEDKNEVKRILTDVSKKKTGDTPLEAFDLANKAYVDSLNSSAVAKIIPGSYIFVSPANGTGVVTVTNIGVQSISAGSAIMTSPANGTGVVTVTNIGVQSVAIGTAFNVSLGTGAVTIGGTGLVIKDRLSQTLSSPPTSQFTTCRTNTLFPPTDTNNGVSHYHIETEIENTVEGMSGKQARVVVNGTTIISHSATVNDGNWWHFIIDIYALGTNNSSYIARVYTGGAQADVLGLVYTSGSNNAVLNLSSAFTVTVDVNPGATSGTNWVSRYMYSTFEI